MAAGGYAWWYIDALSDDGRHGLTLIAFIGSVFSPYYAWAGWSDPLDHCAVNVALYQPGGGRWAMTERRRQTLERTAARLAIGPSALSWEGGALTVRFDEVTAPLPSRLRGQVRLIPTALGDRGFDLDPAGRHRWTPIAPRARVEVMLECPSLAWTGQGYFDTNAGDEPLERAFVGWQWSRAHLARDTLLFYDVERRDGSTLNLALRTLPDGGFETIEAPPAWPLAPTGWRMARAVRDEGPGGPRLRRTLEDAPFYARSALDGRYGGQPAEIVHESLSLDRLRSPIVRAMLPFRMPRVFW